MHKYLCWNQLLECSCPIHCLLWKPVSLPGQNSFLPLLLQFIFNFLSLISFGTFCLRPCIFKSMCYCSLKLQAKSQMENKHLNKLGMVTLPVLPTFRRLRQEDQGHPVLCGKFQIGLYYITNPIADYLMITAIRRRNLKEY